MKAVTKAVIPAAGLGTRFLPATKTIPKEMLPIVDTPTLLYVVEEAVQSGIEDIILIAGRQKTAIEDFFDCSYELEDKLSKEGKHEILQRLLRLRNMANIISIRQKSPLGLGHAVLCARPVTGLEPFAVLLGDEIVVRADGASPDAPLVTKQLCSQFAERKESVVSVMAVAPDQVNKYGIISFDPKRSDEGAELFRVNALIEKPAVGKAPSLWALPGRYVFDHHIMRYLSETKAGILGEIQLTDAMNTLAQNEGLWATGIKHCRRFDAGDKLGYIQANIEMALRNPELQKSLTEYLVSLSKKISAEAGL